MCPHVGGALPYLIGRIDHQTMVLKRGADHIRKAPSEYLRQVWFDSVTPKFAGPYKLLYPSDHPWVDPRLIIRQIESQHFPALFGL